MTAPQIDALLAVAGRLGAPVDVLDPSTAVLHLASDIQLGLKTRADVHQDDSPLGWMIWITAQPPVLHPEHIELQLAACLAAAIQRLLPSRKGEP